MKSAILHVELQFVAAIIISLLHFGHFEYWFVDWYVCHLALHVTYVIFRQDGVRVWRTMGSSHHDERLGKSKGE